MKILFLTVLLAIVVGVFAGSALAGHPRTLQSAALTKTGLRQQMHQSRSAINFFTRSQYRWMIASRHSTCWSLKSQQWRHTCDSARRALIQSRWLYQASSQRLAALTPPAIAHLALWTCIHGGEGAWYDNTGNGYYNGLQMTWNWGHGIVGNPDNYTPTEIMAAAERGYQDSGYSRTWLSGQWPRTVQSCWRYA